MDYDAMPRDAQIVAAVLRDRGVSIDQLAERAGYDDKTIYRYLTGERTLPSIVLRAAFELTLDARLIRLITGAIPACLTFPGSPAPANRPVRVRPLADGLTDAGNAIESTGKLVRYLRTVLRDGAIDGKDLSALEKLVAEGTRAGEHLSRTVASAEAEIERIRAAAERGAK